MKALQLLRRIGGRRSSLRVGRVLCVLLLASAAGVAPPAQEPPGVPQERIYRTTQEALEVIRACAKPEGDPSCDVLAVGYLERAYWSGENWVLAEVMPLAPHCMGAVAEGLDSFLGDVLLKRPKAFLKALSQQPAGQQKSIAAGAAFMDGSGMPDESVETILLAMDHYARRDRYRSAAALCREAILSMQKEVHAWEQNQKSPPDAPLSGRVVATACGIYSITVLLGPPGQERVRTVLLRPETVITTREGGRTSCDNVVFKEVGIWPVTPLTDSDREDPSNPIEALVVILGY